ncbi:MAG: SPASM domain-containing protein [archaeon]
MKYTPTEIHMHGTRACTHKCYYCYTKSGRKYLADRSGELTVAEMNAVVSDFATFIWPSLLGGIVKMTGGEPLIRFSDLVEVADHCNGLEPRQQIAMTTNAALIGAKGAYRQENADVLNMAGLYDLSPAEIVGQLYQRNISPIEVSIDQVHVTLTGEQNKTPFSTLSNAVRHLIQGGYGSDKELLFYMTDDGERSQEILYGLAQENGLKVDDGLHGGGVNVAVSLLKQVQTGNLYGIAQNEIIPPEDIFSFRCMRRSEPMAWEQFLTTYWSDCLSVGWDGTVYACQDMTFAIGNVREDRLTEIVRRLEAREDHPIYGKAIEIVNIYDDLAAKRTWDNCCVGMALSLIHDVRPDLVEPLTTDRQACYTLGRDPEMQDILIEEFHRRRDELLANIAAIDEATEQQMIKMSEERVWEKPGE